MLTHEMKEFFGKGEVDVDLAVILGMLDPGLVKYFWLHSPDSPGFNGVVLPGYNCNKTLQKTK